MREVMPMDGALGNEPAVFVDSPLFVGEGADDMTLTPEEWAAARRWVRSTGRPIRLKPKPVSSLARACVLAVFLSLLAGCAGPADRARFQLSNVVADCDATTIIVETSPGAFSMRCKLKGAR